MIRTYLGQSDNNIVFKFQKLTKGKYLSSDVSYNCIHIHKHIVSDSNDSSGDVDSGCCRCGKFISYLTAMTAAEMLTVDTVAVVSSYRI